ncbi:MAG: hypothetical protein JSW14_01335 [Candidatus Bathyarchaeum sp.]|nr:MAG: hypothetical protein JSW14_01335 [Candidatus Bathyarchaeum sp.]
MSDQIRKEAMKIEIEIMEKEILYLKGKRRARAKRAYYRLLQSCGRTCGLDESIYLMRTE